MSIVSDRFALKILRATSIAEGFVLTERSVEKVIHSIFMKLGLTWEPAVHKRVKPVILYLAESDPGGHDSGSQP